MIPHKKAQKRTNVRVRFLTQNVPHKTAQKTVGLVRLCVCVPFVPRKSLILLE